MELSPEQKAQDERDFYHAWGWLLGVTALGAVVGLIYYLWTEQSVWFKVTAAAEMVAALCWFIDAFTGDPYRKRTHAVILSYFFVVVSLLLLTVPTFVGSKSIGGEPIGILPGCVPEADMKELNCTKSKPVATSATGEGKVQPKAKSGEKAAPAQPKSGTPGANQKTDPQDAGQALNNQWLINIGGVISPQDAPAPKVCGKDAPCRMYVTGGISVPLYFVILALIGGAISLSRRVPEIQKYSENGYVGTPTEPKLQPEVVRERLAFQILQFISAPLIAVTAYQIIRPDTMAGSAALAFTCGFGSETILLMIRGVANGLKPQNIAPAVSGAGLQRTGSVKGKVTNKAGNPLEAAAVTVSSQPSLRAVTNAAGEYTIERVPVGQQEIKAEHTTGQTSTTGTKAVTVESDKKADCDIIVG